MKYLIIDSPPENSNCASSSFEQCTAVAAAATGDANNVIYSSLSGSLLVSLAEGKADLVSAGITHTMGRQVYYVSLIIILRYVSGNTKKINDMSSFKLCSNNRPHLVQGSLFLGLICIKAYSWRVNRRM